MMFDNDYNHVEVIILRPLWGHKFGCSRDHGKQYGQTYFRHQLC